MKEKIRIWWHRYKKGVKIILLLLVGILLGSIVTTVWVMSAFHRFY